MLQLLKISSADLIAYGNSYFSSRLIDAKKLLKLNKAFKIRLGRGLYGECLVIVFFCCIKILFVSKITD